MLVHVGSDRSVRVDLGLAVFLATTGGAINAAGFYAIGIFSANMTGNVSLLSDSLARADWSLALLMLTLLLAYILGAFFSAFLIEIGRKRRISTIYALNIVAEGVLLAMLAMADLLLPAVHSSSLLVVGLSFAMGLQNATTTRISDARVRTTHVSGMATDIGIELAILLGSARERRDSQSVVRARFILHVMTLFAFLGGGVIGVLAYIGIGSYMLLLIAVLLLAVSIPEIRKANRHRE